MTFFTPAPENRLLAVWGFCEPALKLLKSDVLGVFTPGNTGSSVSQGVLQESWLLRISQHIMLLLLPEPQFPLL